MFAVLLVAWAPPIAAAEKRDHVHLKLTLAIAPSKPFSAGDAIGVYAAEMLACPDTRAQRDTRQVVLSWLDRATDLMMSSARANHRDRFDRPGAKIVTTRVALDRAQVYSLGELNVAQGQYCQIRLTLTRLPSRAGTSPLPALDTSIRLTRPGAQPLLALTYPVALVLNLPKPWQATHGAGTLSMALDPASALAVLADAGLSEGAAVQKIVERWSASSHLVLKAKR